MSMLARLAGTAAAAGALVLAVAIPASANLQYGLISDTGDGATPDAAIRAARTAAIKDAADLGYMPNTCVTSGRPAVLPYSGGYEATVTVECRSETVPTTTQ
ncbi:hypothetical protein ACFW1A_24925 [Kitasatospora sp. NPDC058965]|uniref:hypothetical protein n=1 Tax=Kitasatospora sp. NPDC058965 TaxID=3346682 RepID=UPI00369591F6